MTSYGYPPAGQAPPPAQQQPYPQQPQYQQPAQAPYQAPPAPGGYPPQGQAPYPPQAGAQASQQPAQGMPGWHEVDDEAARQAYAQTTAGGGFGPNPQFLKVPGPRGQQTWDNSVHVGYTGSIQIRILPPWAQGKPIFVESRTIFYKSHKYPKGRVLGFQGEDSLYMQAIAAAANSGDARLQRVATDYGRVRTQYLYNVLDLSHPESHTGQDGMMRPYLLGAGKQLHREIGEIAETRGGISRLVNPMHGRPLKYSKTKHGPDMMNIEYSILDLDAEPLHPYFGPVLSNLWDLEAQIPNPTQEEVLEAIRELGLPNPSQTTAQVPAGYPAQQSAAYQPDPNPPHANPYSQPPPQQAAPPPQQAAPPPAQAMPPQQPAAYPPQQPAAYPPQQAAPPPSPPQYGGQAPQYGGQAPQYGGQAPQQFAGAPGSVPPPLPGQAGPPPAPSMAPPPVQSNPGAAPAYPSQVGGEPPF